MQIQIIQTISTKQTETAPRFLQVYTQVRRDCIKRPLRNDLKIVLLSFLLLIRKPQMFLSNFWGA